MLATLQAAILGEFPTFKLVSKGDSKLMKAIDLLLRCITFGAMSGFMTSFVTTLGTTVYTDLDWDTTSDINKAVVLRHERVHMRQRRRYGGLLYSLMYLVLPLPCGLAYYRSRFEMEAYAETLLAVVELIPGGAEIVQTERYRNRVVSFFTGPAYFWTWPHRRGIEAWYDRALKAALSSVHCPV